MVKISTLFISVLTLFLFMIPGFILRKTKIADSAFPKSLSVLTLYVAQIALIFHSFIIKFDLKILENLSQVFVCAFLIHLVLYILAKQFFKKAPDKMRRVLQFGLVFSNAGYMGIPVISDVFGADHAIYATFYVVWFNIFCFSLGRLIYTEDKKYISFKKAIFNPAVTPIIIALVIFLTGGGTWIVNVINEPTIVGTAFNIIYKVLETLKNMVAPVSMMVIGARLADIDFKGIIKDKYMYPFIALRLLILPAIIWGMLKLISLTGLLGATPLAVLVILASTPAAAVTTMFAELYDGDSPYAGKLVALTTILSVITMPVVALLLYI